MFPSCLINNKLFSFFCEVEKPGVLLKSQIFYFLKWRHLVPGASYEKKIIVLIRLNDLPRYDNPLFTYKIIEDLN